MFEFAFHSRLYYFGVLIQSNTKLTATERLNLRGKKTDMFCDGNLQSNSCLVCRVMHINNQSFSVVGCLRLAFIGDYIKLHLLNQCKNQSLSKLL